MADEEEAREDVSAAARTRTHLETTVRRALREESHRNELRLAYVRSLLLGLHVASVWVIDGLIEPEGLAQFWIDNVIVSVLLVGSLLIVHILRSGRYSLHLRILIPIGDTCLLLVIFLPVVFRHGSDVFSQYEIRTTLALTMAAVAMSGSVRLHPKAAYLTTGLAIVGYHVVAGAVGWKQIDILATAILGGLGYFGVWLTRIAQRAAEDEVARGVLGRFLPESVVEQAHRDPLALLENPRSIDATIMVSDIRGFTSFAESAPPDEVFEVLNRVHGAMAEVVRQFGGAIDKFTGDGMLGIFGLASDEDHAGNALKAAACMRQVSEDLRPSLARYNLDLALGIALHSGPVLVGCIGSTARLEFTVIGDAVNTAFRLQDLTKEFKVDLLVSQDTAKRVDAAAYGLQSLGRATIRGRAQTLDVLTLPTTLAR